MPLTVNLRHLEEHPVRLAGALPVAELDLDTRDEVIHVSEPLAYELEVEGMDGGLLARGWLHLNLDCQCVRCLKAFKYRLKLPHWTVHLPFEGEEAVKVTNDLVDLTPYVREDILLEFPQHPLCDPECRGLPKSLIGRSKKTSSAKSSGQESSTWAALNKLKL